MARSPSRKKARPAPRKAAAPKRRPAAKKPVSRPKPAPPKPKAAPVVKKPKGSTPAPAAPLPEPAPLVPRTGDARRHLLSLSFLRDGDEFLARMESDSGQITELKNRSLDQLLSLVANELEDLLQ